MLRIGIWHTKSLNELTKRPIALARPGGNVIQNPALTSTTQSVEQILFQTIQQSNTVSKLLSPHLPLNSHAIWPSQPSSTQPPGCIQHIHCLPGHLALHSPLLSLHRTSPLHANSSSIHLALMMTLKNQF